MKDIVIMLGLLLLPYWALIPAHVSEPLRGRIGVSLMFAFAAMGHFIKTSQMAQILPPGVPMRIPLIYLSGVFELLAAISIQVAPLSRCAGIVLCVFLILIIYAAFQRVDFGGHGAGPVYLLVRIPLQFFLIGWIYWFSVKQN